MAISTMSRASGRTLSSTTGSEKRRMGGLRRCPREKDLGYRLTFASPMLRAGAWLTLVVLVMFLAIATGRAWANGAFPESNAVLLPGGHPRQIILSTNFGLILSDDDGAT